MHQLHLVGFTADHDGLIFSTKKGATSGAYVVGIDDALFAALEEARRMAMSEPDDAAARSAAERVRALRPTQRSNLSVRDIQSRLRSGMTLAQVAAEAGVDETWVGRFAAPVIAEQAAVIERALDFSLTSVRKGASSRPLGEAVRWNLTDRGISADTSSQAAGWSAYQLEPGQWALRFTYTSRGRPQAAEWEVDLEARELVGRNRLASELGFVEAGARRRKAVEVAPPPPPPAAKKATSGRKGTPARTKTARAQAAKATSSKAAVVRAKATKAASPARPAPARAGAPAPRRATTGRPAEPGRRAAGTAGAAPSKRGGAGSGRSAAPAGRESPEPAEKPVAKGTARFPAPRPAAGRTDRPEPTPARPRLFNPAPQARPRPAPAAAPPPRAEPARPAAPPRRTEPPAAASEPTFRPVPAPPQPAPPRPRSAEPTADARPMPTTATGEPPARAGTRPVAPRQERSPTVRRIPSPSTVAAYGRPDGEPDATAFRPEPPAPAPAPEPVPDPPRPAPTVRPVGGGDGRPTILIIDADRAGDRRRS